MLVFPKAPLINFIFIASEEKKQKEKTCFWIGLILDLFSSTFDYQEISEFQQVSEVFLCLVHSKCEGQSILVGQRKTLLY